MAEYNQQQGAPFNAYSWMENDFLSRQAAQADQQMQNDRFSQEMAQKEMQAPAEIAQSGLARMTAERDQRLLPMQEEVATQNIDAEKNFNRLRQMRALMDDPDIAPEQKKDMIQTGFLRNMGINGQPTLPQAHQVSRSKYIADLLDRNPEGLRKYLDTAMESYSRTAKSTQQQGLAETRGNIQHTNTLLRGQIEEDKARLRASLGGGTKFSKSWHEHATKQMEIAKARYGEDSTEALKWELQSKEAEMLGLQQKAEAQGSGVVASLSKEGGLSTKQKPATQVTPPPAAKAPANIPVIKWTKDAQGKPIRVQE